jgi:hypothetical protein
MLPLDDYSPGRAVRVATNPLTEVAGAAIAVALAGATPAWRAPRRDEATGAQSEYVDPMIYAVVDRSGRVPITGITVGVSALVLVATGAHVL